MSPHATSSRDGGPGTEEGWRASASGCSAAFGDARTGRGGVVIIEGEAWIGKSRLLTEVVGKASRSGFRVLLGRCHESEQILPFGPWVEALPLRRARARRRGARRARAGVAHGASASLPGTGELGSSRRQRRPQPSTKSNAWRATPPPRIARPRDQRRTPIGVLQEIGVAVFVQTPL